MLKNIENALVEAKNKPQNNHQVKQKAKRTKKIDTAKMGLTKVFSKFITLKNGVKIYHPTSVFVFYV